MALSNWDTLAVDLQGNPTNGVFVSPADVRVSIYKNWVYIHDEKAWHEGCRYDKPCIMEIQHGYVQYMDVHIMAIRGPQEGVYVAVWHENYDNNQKEINGMIGCGVYGYDGEDWVGVIEESKQFLKKWITGNHKSYSEEEIKEWTEKISRDSSPEVKADIEAILREDVLDFPAEIAKVNLDKALRFNQGDEFFAKNLGFETPATEVGDSQPTIMSEIIDNMGDKND